MCCVHQLNSHGRDKSLFATFGNYMRGKGMANVAVTESQLNWVISRPGTFMDEKSVAVHPKLTITYYDVLS